MATGLLPAAAGARSVAEKLGIRYVYVTLLSALPAVAAPPAARAAGPAVATGRDRQPGAVTTWTPRTINALFGEALNTHRASIGLPPVDNVRDHVFTDQPWLAADPTLAPWQEPAGPRRRADRRVDPAGRTPAPGRVGGVPGRRHTTGVRGLRQHARAAAKDAARVAIEAIRAQGRRALVARGWADLALIDDRDDCFAVGEVNQQALFGRVAAVVHHGGAGTTTTAARAGAPQVVVPQMADQPYWAGRVADLGIGAAHDGPTPTTESLSAALRTALTPETRARATAVAGTIRTDGATVAATLLLDAVSPHLRSELMT